MRSSPGFDEAYARLFSSAVQVTERVTGDRGLAEDVAVETLARARVYWRWVRHRAEAWVVGNAARRALRVARRHPEIEDVQPLTGLHELPRPLREAVTLCDIVRLDPADAAEVLGCSRRAVIRRRSRGKEQLQWR